MNGAERRPVALVTGASRGIGRGIAEALAAAGFSVAINYRGNREAAAETSSACRGISSRFPQSEMESARYEVFQADIGVRGDRERLLEEVVGSYGTIDALVNNAGMAPRQRADLLETAETSFEELIRTNLQGPYFLTQSLARLWLDGNRGSRKEIASGATAAAVAPVAPATAAEATPDTAAPVSPATAARNTTSTASSVLPGGRKIVFITSISADTASLNRGEYCVSKAGLAMAVQLFAWRLADRGIQVYEVRPGIVATDMTSGVREKYDALIGDGVVPQKRWGMPADVGAAVRALLSGGFSYSTGAVIPVDGGFHISRL